MTVSAAGIENVKDRFGNQITYNRSGGALTSITDSRGETHTLAFYATGRLQTLTMADGAVWEFKYNTLNQLWKVIGPVTTSFSSGIIYEFRYSNGASSASLNSNMVAAADGRGHWWLRNVYDSSDRVTSQFVGTGEFTFDYSAASSSQQVTVTDRIGNDRVWTWDATKLTKASLVENTNRNVRSGEGDYTTSWITDSDGYQTAVTYPEGNGVKTTLNSLKMPTEVRRKAVMSAADSSSDLVQSYTYDPSKFYGCSQFTDELTRVTTYTLNAKGQPETVAFPMVTGASVPVTNSYAYNSNGTLDTFTDGEALGYATEYDHDGNLNVIEKRVKNIDHDGTWLASPQWWRTAYIYTVMDQPGVIEEWSSDTQSRTTTLAYDANDQMERVTRDSRVTTMLYDERGLLYQRTRELGATDAVEEFTYDGNRNMTVSKNPRGFETTQVFDGYDRVTQVINALGHYEQRIYDKAGHVLERKQYEEAGATDVLLAHHRDTFDEMGRRWKEEDALIGGSTSWLARTFAFDEDSAVVTVTDRLSNNTTITYDAAGRRDSVTDPIGNLTEWEYDENGNVTATVETEKIPGSSSTEAYRTEMEYDQINRMK
ncbi:MAG: hypothetical protein K8T90_18660, partial [Planctomycetes bacterium]|nr:hypothetical protein [Planctomycetota bacterium]